ncbi:MAG: hypothetical protein HC845_06125 [Akkermansiaceae bacterium]|nr:hypothetical protein [Akkermansiaceae bacterium]
MIHSPWKSHYKLPAIGGALCLVVLGLVFRNLSDSEAKNPVSPDATSPVTVKSLPRPSTEAHQREDRQTTEVPEPTPALAATSSQVPHQPQASTSSQAEIDFHAGREKLMQSRHH